MLSTASRITTVSLSGIKMFPPNQSKSSFDSMKGFEAKHICSPLAEMKHEKAVGIDVEGEITPFFNICHRMDITGFANNFNIAASNP